MLRWKKSCISSTAMSLPTTPAVEAGGMVVPDQRTTVSNGESDFRDKNPKESKCIDGAITSVEDFIPRPFECGKTQAAVNATVGQLTPNEVNNERVPSVVVPAEADAFLTSEKRLLSCPDDISNLNALHCFVRSNTEVFCATKEDIDAPAPGRKKKILPNQIGLRCIHCAHVPTLERVKRAICYPSTIGRIYHCVSDMKFDHFSLCPEIPHELRGKFLSLKASSFSKKSIKSSVKCSSNSSSTAQYYCDCARKMGLIERSCGVFLKPSKNISSTSSTKLIESQSKPVSMSPSLVSVCSTGSHSCPEFADECNSISGNEVFRSCSFDESGSDESLWDAAGTSHMKAGSQEMLFDRPPCSPSYCASSRSLSMNTPCHGRSGSPSFICVRQSSRSTPHQNIQASDAMGSKALKQSDQTDKQRCLLSMPGDSSVLNPLHCFVRDNIEVFAATKEDVEVPAPGRKVKIAVGQVGIRCVHCCNMPSKYRVKRAVCYHPSVQGIYHCVSNMKFDHFEACRGIPEDLRCKLFELKSKCSRKGGSQSANCTSQYYVDAASKMGLIDTPYGICYSDDNGAKQNALATSFQAVDVRKEQSQASDGLSALAIAASRHSFEEESKKRKMPVIEFVPSNEVSPSPVHMPHVLTSKISQQILGQNLQKACIAKPSDQTWRTYSRDADIFCHVLKRVRCD